MRTIQSELVKTVEVGVLALSLIVLALIYVAPTSESVINPSTSNSETTQLRGIWQQ